MCLLKCKAFLNYFILFGKEFQNLVDDMLKDFSYFAVWYLGMWNVNVIRVDFLVVCVFVAKVLIDSNIKFD
jgi:hypothetical protein